MSRFALVVSSLLAAVTCVAAEPPSWPELKALDAVAATASDLARKQDAGALRMLLANVQAAATAFVDSAAPADLAKPDDVATLRGDIKTFAAQLKDPASLSDPDLVDLCAGLHPIVVALFEAAGIPHRHDDAAPSDTTPESDAKPGTIEVPVAEEAFPL